MNLDTLRRALRPLAIRISNVVRRGVIKRVDDGKQLQEVQASLLDGEVRDDVERFQQYGFTSVPIPGAEGVFLLVGGRSDQTYCVATEDRRHRVNLQEGEVAVYSKHGQTIILKTNGDIEATPKAGQKFKVVGATELAGDVTVTGTLTASVDVVGGGKSLATHTHPVAGGNSGGPVVFVPPGSTGAPS